jgi:hypothetical protein
MFRGRTGGALTSLKPFVRFAFRDVVIVVVLVAAWWCDTELRERQIDGLLAWSVGIAAGLLTTLAAFLCHEWGHLLGAVGSSGVVHAPKRLWSPFLFFFDVAASDRRAFLWMSYGGYIASAIALAALCFALPWHALSGRVALATAAVGVAATFALEVPKTIRVARGGALPRGAVFADEAGPPEAAEGGET